MDRFQLPTDSPKAPAARGRRDTVRASFAYYRRIFAFFRPDWLLLSSLAILIWTALGLGVLEGVVVALLFDAVLSSHSSGIAARLFAWLAGDASRLHRVIVLAVVWLLTRVANDTVTLLREMINNRVRYNGTARVRRELFDHLQSLSPAYHKSRPQGDAIYRLSIDSQGFFGVLDTSVGAANSVLSVFVIALVMAQFNATITRVCVCLAPLLLLANRHFSRTIRRTSAVSKQIDADFTTFIQRAMATVLLAQLFGRQRTESQRFAHAVDRTVVEGMAMSWQQQLYPWSQRVLYALGHAFILGYGGYLVLGTQAPNQPTPLTVGGVTAMLVYLGQLWEPVRRMAGFTADVQTNLAACARVFSVIDLTPTVTDAPATQALAVKPRTVALEGVTFGYDPALPPVLVNITARAEPGELVAFVGRSGAGKSTLLNLLPRFYDPNAGVITLGGRDLRTIRLTDIRAHIALVPQDSPVIAGTIADNIAFGHGGAAPEAIRAAAQMAGASTFIDELPFGYETEVTEAGQNLSGGQRQRLAIARALLSEAPILVLDEPTSGLDRHHEQLVLDTLHRLKRKRTVILVTHQLTSVSQCDRIYCLQPGKPAECGTHEQLLAQRGYYASMLREAVATPRAAQVTNDEAA